MTDTPTAAQLAVLERLRLKREQDAAAEGTVTSDQQRVVDSVMSQRPEDQRPHTWGETGVDMAKSLGSGFARGATSLADMPSDIVQGGLGMVERATGYDIPEWVERGSVAFLPGGMNRAISGESSTEALTRELPSVMGYKSKTTPGKYAGTVGEFLPGAIAGPSGIVRNVVTQGVIPALASETAGQMTEGSAYEPYARFAGALLGGGLANTGENVLRRTISPGGGAAADDLAHAARLREAGMDVTAGQATKNPNVLAIEANNPALQSTYNVADDSPQLMDFTKTVLKEAGLTDDIAARAAAQPDFIGNPYTAKPQVMKELRVANSALYDDALNGVSVAPLRSLSQPVYDALKIIRDIRIPSAPYEIRQAGSILRDAVRDGRTVPATELNRIRSALGEHLSSTDPNIVKVVRMTRDAIDKLIDNATNAMGDPKRMETLLEARRRTQAILVAEHAVKNGTPRGANGIITPADLSGGLKAIYGNTNLTTGNINNAMGNLAESGLRVIRDLGKPTGSGWRSALPFAELGGGIATGLGAAQGAMFLGAPPSLAAVPAVITAGGAALDAARRGVRQLIEANAHRPIVQKYLENQLVNPSSGRGTVGSAVRGAISGVPTYSTEGAGPQADGGRVGRKAGGRVSSHEHAADQLVRAAERAKKGWSAETEPLLNQSDDAVAHALEVANRSI
jgi:hypothetical protein